MTRPARSRSAATELKIPAQSGYVIVAKRAASALGSTAGFSLEGIDDLNIAVAQACEKAIAAADRMWGPGNGVLKLTFHLVDEGIEVEVRSMAAPAPDVAVVAESTRRRVEIQRQKQVKARAEIIRLAEVKRRLAAASLAGGDQSEVDFDDLAVNMIRLFVDELRYNVDSRGAMRMRMVKYHVD